MKSKLSQAEKKLLASVEKGEWKSAGKGTKRSYATLAKQQIKEKRINIRLSEDTLNSLREDAIAAGIPYQTLISSILHRYAQGRMFDEVYLKQALKLLK